MYNKCRLQEDDRMRFFALAVLALAFQEEAEDVAVAREWKGDDTRITTAEVHRVTDAADWAKLWERHTGRKERAPEVDFARHMVVACFLGERTFEEAGLYKVKKTKEEVVFGVLLEEKDCCDFSKHALYYMGVVPRSDLKLTVIARVKQELDVDPKKDEILKELPALDK
jgi:hypothetical protein